MATKAEMAAELALLREKCAKRDPKETNADPKPDFETTADLTSWLAKNGFETGDTTDLLERLTKELDGLARDKPLLTAGAAFALGFTLGRMSK